MRFKTPDPTPALAPVRSHGVGASISLAGQEWSDFERVSNFVVS
jgi:hypothetical protein